MPFQPLARRAETLALRPTIATTARNPYFVYLASLAAGSRPSMISALEIIARKLGYADPRECPWASLRYEHTTALRAWFAEKYAPATANKFICAVRGVLREAHRLELLPTSDYQRAKDLPAIRGSRTLRGRALARGEIGALFEACDRSRPMGYRDAAMLSLLYGCGLRRAEVVALDFEHVTESAIKVRGKGNKERIVYMPDGGVRHVQAWVRVRGEEPGPLLYPTHKNGRMLVRVRMSRETVFHALKTLARTAGVARFTPHDCRRTFVGDLLDAGADLSTVQHMAGHSQATTTARYDRRGERAKAKAAELLVVPFCEDD